MNIRNIENDENGKVCKFEYVKFGDVFHKERYRLIFMRRNSYSKFWITIAVFRNTLDLDGGTVSFMTRESHVDGEQAVFDKLIASGIEKLEDKLRERKNKVNEMCGMFFEDKE